MIVRTAQLIVIKVIIARQSCKLQLSYIGNLGTYFHYHTVVLSHIRNICPYTFSIRIFRTEVMAISINTYKVNISANRGT